MSALVNSKSTIVRKYWFVHDGVEEPEGEKAGRVTGMRNRSEYNTLKHIADYMIINYVGCPDGPRGAVWKNYTGKPCPKERSRPDDGQWKKVDASMTSVFGKPYLTEEDWRINI